MWSDGIAGRDPSLLMGALVACITAELANPQASSLIEFTPAPAAPPALKMTCWYANLNVLPAEPKPSLTHSGWIQSGYRITVSKTMLGTRLESVAYLTLPTKDRF
jgi:hypothetical protein